MHGIGGIAGSILTGVFVASDLGGAGLPEGVTVMNQVAIQTLAVIVTIAWSAIFSFAILKLIDQFVGLRVEVEQEVEGLDIVLHEETGYHNL